MKLHDKITNRAPRNGYICDKATDLKAREEGKYYSFFVISPGFYLCQNAENAYVIEETTKTVGCACHAMTFKHPGEVCKHIVAIGFLNEVPTTPVTEEHKKLLRWEGWIGDVHLIPPASYQQKPQQKKKAEKPKEATRQGTKDSHEKWKGMTPAQMCEAMDDKELARNARRGGVAAIAEQERRKAVG